MAKTLQNLLDDTRQIIGQPDAANSNFTDAQITKWLNDAYRRIVMSLDLWPMKERDYTVASQAVTLNSLIERVKYAKFKVQPENKFRELEIIRLDELMRLDPDWENATSGIPRYFCRTGTAAGVVYPPLNTANQNQTLRLYAMEMPTELAATTDTPDIPPSTHDFLPHWAAFRCFQFLDRTDEATVQVTIFRGGVKDEKSAALGASTAERQWKWADRDDD